MLRVVLLVVLLCRVYHMGLHLARVRREVGGVVLLRVVLRLRVVLELIAMLRVALRVLLVVHLLLVVVLRR